MISAAVANSEKFSLVKSLESCRSNAGSCAYDLLNYNRIIKVEEQLEKIINSTKFSDVRIPDSQRLGAEGEGWKVALTTLMNERLAVGDPPGLDFDQIFEATITGGTNLSIEIPLIDDIQDTNITNDAPETFPLGETIVTWTATDSSGNSASATQTITVVDTTNPIISIPSNIQVEATSMENTIVDYGFAQASDQVEVSSITNDAPETFPLGETIVTWTATDSSGNSASATQTITVVDTTAPTLNAPQNITIDTESIDTVLEIGLASVNDIIDDAPSITNDAPEVFPLGETIVTWTATDKFGNTSLSTQTISLKVCGNSPSYYNMIVGTDDDDLLIGTTMADLIFAKAGDDIISADKGNDCIIAGDGDDIIFGNEGNDHISGQGGNDILKGNSGEDVIIGGNGLDVIDGGEDIDTCKIIDERNRDIVIRCELDE